MSSATDNVPSDSTALDSADAGARFIRGGAVRIAAFGVSLLASAVSAPLVIRHLGPTGYGYFATVSAIIFIVGGFTEGGLNTLGVREFASGRSDRLKLLRNLVGLRVTATAVAVVIAAIAAALLGAPGVVGFGILVAGAGLIVTIAGENYGIPLSAELRLTAVSALTLAQQITLTICYVIVVLVGGRVLPLLAATMVSGGVLLAGAGLLIRDQTSIVPAFDWAVWRSLLAQTLPYAVASAVGIIYFRETLVLMSILGTVHETGIYAAAFRIVEVLAVIPWTLISAAFPILSRAAHQGDESRLAYAMQRLFDTSLIAGVWVSGSILVGAPFAIAVVAGPSFRASVPVLEIQGLAVVTSFMVALFGSVLLSLRLFRPLVVANVIAVTVATVLALILIPAAGAKGAAVAPTVAEASLAISYAFSLWRTRESLRVSVRLVPRIALAAAVSLGITYSLPIPSVVAIVVFGLSYFACIGLLRAIPFEVINALRGR